MPVDSEALRQRKRAVYRIMALEVVGVAVGAAIVGVALGLSEDSVGWGFASAFVFLGFVMIMSLAVLAFRGQLRNAWCLYGKAARRSFSGGRASKSQ
jgi:FtsH-binding integral membrane protein